MKTENSVHGKLIVIDGIDGCGKATQAAHLVEALQTQGCGVETMSFPRYQDGFSGRFLDRLLHGERGDFTTVDAYVASYPYAHDRWQAAPIIRGWLAEGKTVVLDRYQSANVIHQGCKCPLDHDLVKYVEWLDELEFEVNGIPKPDLVMVLSIPAWVSQQLMRRRNVVRTVMMSDLERVEFISRKDISEDDEEHQASAERNISRIFAIKPEWQRISCFL